LFNNTATREENGRETSPTQAPARPEEPAEREELSLISSVPVVSPALALDEASVWYFDSGGRLLNFIFDQGTEQVFELPFIYGVEKVLWPPTGNDFIIKAADGVFRLYKAEEQVFIDLPKNIKELAWLPDGKRIVYIWQRADGGLELKVSNSDGSNYSKVADLFTEYRLVSSPVEEAALLIQPLNEGVNRVFKVSLADGTFTEILDRGKNIAVKFSPDGKKLLFARLNEDQGLPELWLHDFSLGTYENLKITTVPDKVVWSASSQRFYFGLPKNILVGDPEITTATSDTLYYYDLASKQTAKVPVYSADGSVDYRDLLITTDERALIFRNGRNGKLYKLNLQ